MDINQVAKSLKDKFKGIVVAGKEETSKEYISTGNLGLDLALEGGIAWGYVTEWAGLSGTCKSTMLQIMMANAQREYGAYGVVLDREKSWHKERLIQLGIDVDNVLIVPPQDIPQIHDATEFLELMLPKLDKKAYIFVAVDSISAFDDPLKAKKQDMGKKAQQAHRLFRRTLPMVTKNMSLNFSNHITFKTGVVFGDPKTVTTGEAPKYYTSYRLELNEAKLIKDENKGGEDIGSWIKATVVKTRSGPNRRSVVFPHYYKDGIPYYGGYARFLVSRNYLQPKNVKEFEAFKQVMVKYGDTNFSEFDIEEKLKKYPELLFTEWPEWCENVVVEEEREEDPLEGVPGITKVEETG